jgi:nicotinamidase-related amidase
MDVPAIYLVMDMINDLVHADGPNGAAGFGPEVAARGIVERTAEAIRLARLRRIAIGFVRIGFSADYRECSPTNARFRVARERGLFKLGTWGTEVHPALGSTPGDFDIVKHRVSPLYGTALEPILRSLGVGVIYLSGVSTNGVVHSAARELHDRDFQCHVLEDCCAALSAEEHRQAIACMRGFATMADSAKAFA